MESVGPYFCKISKKLILTTFSRFLNDPDHHLIDADVESNPRPVTNNCETPKTAGHRLSYSKNNGAQTFCE